MTLHVAGQTEGERDPGGAMTGREKASPPRTQESAARKRMPMMRLH